MIQPVFRVFLSSTFGDFKKERDHLQAELWPKLKTWCSERGASFEVVDLRWGISEDDAKNHETIQICLDEIKQCQHISPRPNFIVLLGDRYGWRPLPSVIPQEEFVAISKHYKSNFSANVLLSTWYSEDTNAIPPHYRLIPYTEKTKTAWEEAEPHLKKLLRSAAEALDVTPERHELYFLSATHLEIRHGLLKNEDASDHVFVFQREIKNLTSVGDGLALGFADYLPDGKPDEEAKKLLKDLREEIGRRLPKQQTFRYEADWQGGICEPISTNHLKALAEDIERSLMGIIESQLNNIERKDPLEEENHLHSAFANQVGNKLFGRDVELQLLREYTAAVRQPEPQKVCVVNAPAGLGKSALLANVYNELFKERKSGACVIGRFIGATPRSWSLISFLYDLFNQISIFYGKTIKDLPGWNINHYSENFANLLSLASKEKPLIVLIDAIDQFVEDVEVFIRQFLPEELPPHVALIISVLDGEYQKQLVRLYANKQIELKPLEKPEISGDLLDYLLANGGIPAPPRKLSEDQRANLLKNANGSPLYITLVATLARSLKSGETAPELPPGENDLVKYIIEEISKKRGELITKRALGYIACARYGLSEYELQKVLWQDKLVLGEFSDMYNNGHEPPPFLPSVIWFRLYREFSPYIHKHLMDGELLYRFFHRVFGEVAEYLNKEILKELHSNLADFFNFVPGSTPYARTVMELPFQLNRSTRHKETERVITNFDFAMAKCALNRSDDWVLDFSNTVSKLAEVQSVTKIWCDFVRQRAHILRRGDNLWPSHKILLQLAVEHADDSPITKAAEIFIANKSCNWKWMKLSQRKQYLKLSNCLSVLDGHSDKIIGTVILSNSTILSWSVDNTLQVWSFEGNRIKSEKAHTNRIRGVKLLAENKIITFSDDGLLRIWSYNLDRLASLERHAAPVVGVELTFDNNIVSYSLDGNIIVWSPDGKDPYILFSSPNPVYNLCLLPEKKILFKIKGYETWLHMEVDKNAQAEGKIRFSKDGYCPHSSNANPIVIGDGRILTWSDNILYLSSAKDVKAIKFEGHEKNIEGALILHDKKLMSWDNDGNFIIWSIDGKEMSVLKHDSYAKTILLSDGKIVTWSSYSIKLWRPDGILLKTTERDIFNNIYEVRPLSAGRFISWDGQYQLKLWSTDGDLQATLKKHVRAVLGVIELTDGKIISWSADNTIQIWSKDGENLAVFQEHSRPVVNVNPISNTKLISWSEDNKLRIWSIEHLEKTDIRPQFEDLKFTTDRNIISYSGNTLSLWSSNRGNQVDLYEHEHDIKDVIILSDGNLISWSIDKIVLWTSEGKGTIINDGYSGSFAGVVLLSTGRLLSWSFEKNTMTIWSLEREIPVILEGHTESIKEVWVLDHNRILSWSLDNTFRLWGSDGTSIAVMPGHHGTYGRFYSLPDGGLLTWILHGLMDYYDRVKGNPVDFSIRVWSAEGKLLSIFDEHSDEIKDAQLLPNGTVLSRSKDDSILISSLDGKLLDKVICSIRADCLRVLKNGRILLWTMLHNDLQLSAITDNSFGSKLLKGHEKAIIDAKEFADGRIVTWSKDCLILWTTDGDIINVLKGHSGDIVRAYIFDEKQVLSWSSDKTLCVWSSEGALIYSKGIKKIFELPDDIWKAFIKYSSEDYLSMDDIHTPDISMADNGIVAFDDMLLLNFNRHSEREVLFWHGEYEVKPHFILDDGKVIISQNNREVNVLQVVTS